MENNENRTIPFFKISISIIFGILGFAINFQTIKFPFPPYIAVVLIGLLFPMLITFSWGWKYGLLSAVLSNASESMEGKGRIRVTCRNRIITDETVEDFSWQVATNASKHDFAF